MQAKIASDGTLLLKVPADNPRYRQLVESLLGDDDQPHDTKDLAELYAEMWHRTHPYDVGHHELATAHAELHGGTHGVNWDGDKWHVSAMPRSVVESVLLEEVRHAPKGEGITIKGKHFKPGQFIPLDAYKQATPDQKAAIDKPAEAAASARKARGSVDHDKLASALAPHAHHELTAKERLSAKRSFNALHRHHGDLVVHRLEEIAGELQKAHDREGNTEGQTVQYSRRLRAVQHQVEMAKEKGLHGDLRQHERVTAEEHPGDGSIVEDGAGKQFVVIKSRHGLVTAAPIVDGKAKFDNVNVQQFVVGENRGEPVTKLYKTGRNYHEEQEAKKKAVEEKPKQDNNIVREIGSLSSGTLANLFGTGSMAEIDQKAADWQQWAGSQPGKFETWQDAWEAYKPVLDANSKANTSRTNEEAYTAATEKNLAEMKAGPDFKGHEKDPGSLNYNVVLKSLADVMNRDKIRTTTGDLASRWHYPLASYKPSDDFGKVVKGMSDVAAASLNDESGPYEVRSAFLNSSENTYDKTADQLTRRLNELGKQFQVVNDHARSLELKANDLTALGVKSDIPQQLHEKAKSLRDRVVLKEHNLTKEIERKAEAERAAAEAAEKASQFRSDMSGVKIPKVNASKLIKMVSSGNMLPTAAATGYATDGRFVVKLNDKDKGKFEEEAKKVGDHGGRKLSEVQVSRPISEKHNEPAKIVGVRETDDAPAPVYLMQGEGKQQALVDSRFHQAILSQYPDAVPHMPVKDGGIVIYKSGGEPVGAVVSLENERAFKGGYKVDDTPYSAPPLTPNEQGLKDLTEKAKPTHKGVAFTRDGKDVIGDSFGFFGITQLKDDDGKPEGWGLVHVPSGASVGSYGTKRDASIAAIVTQAGAAGPDRGKDSWLFKNTKEITAGQVKHGKKVRELVDNGEYDKLAALMRGEVEPGEVPAEEKPVEQPAAPVESPTPVAPVNSHAQNTLDKIEQKKKRLAEVQKWLGNDTEKSSQTGYDVGGIRTNAGRADASRRLDKTIDLSKEAIQLQSDIKHLESHYSDFVAGKVTAQGRPVSQKADPVNPMSESAKENAAEIRNAKNNLRMDGSATLSDGAKITTRFGEENGELVADIVLTRPDGSTDVVRSKSSQGGEVEKTAGDVIKKYQKSRQELPVGPPEGSEVSVPVEPEPAPTFNYANAVTIAADSIGELRKQDVHRVMDSMQDADKLSGMGEYITANRPELQGAVDEAAKDIAEERGYGKGEAKEPWEMDGQRDDESRDAYIKRMESITPRAKNTRVPTKEDVDLLRDKLRAIMPGLSVKQSPTKSATVDIYPPKSHGTNPFTPDEGNAIRGVLRELGYVDHIDGSHMRPTDASTRLIGGLVLDADGPRKEYVGQPEHSNKPNWEKTFDEFASSHPGMKKIEEARKSQGNGQRDAISGIGKIKDDHREDVSVALDAGRPVPPEVLADYPDLAAKYGKGADLSASVQAVTPEKVTLDELARRKEDDAVAATKPAEVVGDTAPVEPSTPDPETEHAGPLGEVPDPSPDTDPRQLAEDADKALKSDYEFARSSAIPNMGKDLKGAARHKVNAWRGLEQAEKDGTAESLMTRDNLLKNEPPDLLAKVTPANALSALASHLAVSSFPAIPYDDKTLKSYLKYHGQRTAEELRKQYYDAYQKIKDEAERLASSEVDPRKTTESLCNTVQSIIKGIRNTGKKNEYGVELRDSYNPVANGLCTLGKRLFVGYRSGKNDVINRVKDFSNRLGKAYGDTPTEDMLSKAAEHVKDVMEGDSFNKTFGTVESGKKGFDPATLYVKHANRRGGRVIDAASVEAGKNFMMNSLKMSGLQWGNSVTDSERQHHLQKSSEALADLADVLGLPDRAISLGSSLGLAIGARGHGSALAHYEPGKSDDPSSRVINLTRKNGVGSLAHEWGHALDHYLTGGKISSDGEKTGGDYMSNRTSARRVEKDVNGNYYKDENGKVKHTDYSTDPVWAGMNEVRKAMKESGFDSRLINSLNKAIRDGEISRDKAANYWNSGHEKFARTFEVYVKHKLGEQGRENTYLSGVNNHPFWPNEEEITKIGPAMSGLMDAVRKKHFSDDGAGSIIESLEQENVLFDFLPRKDSPLGHEFASTQFNLADDADVSQASKVLAMAARIADADLAEGRESEPHITALYGLHSQDPSDVAEVVRGFGPVTVTFGATSVFPGDDHDVVIVQVFGQDLYRLNDMLRDSLEHTETHSQYMPHVTLAYVKPGTGEKYAGMMDLFREEATFGELVFSDREGEQFPIHLLADEEEADVNESLESERPSDVGPFIVHQFGKDWKVTHGATGLGTLMARDKGTAVLAAKVMGAKGDWSFTDPKRFGGEAKGHGRNVLRAVMEGNEGELQRMARELGV